MRQQPDTPIAIAQIVVVPLEINAPTASLAISRLDALMTHREQSKGVSALWVLEATAEARNYTTYLINADSITEGDAERIMRAVKGQ